MAPPSRAELVSRLQSDVAQTVADGVELQHAIAARLGLSLAELRAITLLMRGPASAGELADAADLTTGAATRMIDRLEIAGWVVRHPDETDRRKVAVVLKKIRHDEIDKLYASMSASWRDALADKSDEDLAKVLELFDRMRTVAREHTNAMSG